MTKYKEILRLYQHLGVSKLQIAESLGCSRSTVVGVTAAATDAGITWEQVKELSDREIKTLLFPQSGAEQPRYKMPDYEYIHKEMGRTGVTLSLLWVEYCEECRCSGELPYQSTQFYKYYRDYAKKNRATMHINRKPGDIMEADWAGGTMSLTCPLTGESITAYIFVASLVYSKYSFVKAYLSQKEADWIGAHNCAYKFFGGTTRILCPDNLKTGITKNSKEETIVNQTYQEMAEHYDTAILPARPKKPRDKGSVEGEVGVVSTWIIAALRNRTFFTLHELNDAISEKLNEYNAREFKKKDGSRYSMYLEEKAYLRPLPVSAFEIAVWKKAKLQDNYHIQHDSRYYSAPYEYIGRDLDVRICEGMIEIFFAGTRIASHPLLKATEGKYSTREEHMPEKHRKFGEWNSDRFKSWADKFGPNTRAVVDYFFGTVKVEQQAYKTCNALLHLADKYSAARLESACEKALSFSPFPSLRSVKAILASGRDKIAGSDDEHSGSSGVSHGFVRGADYYKGGND